MADFVGPHAFIVGPPHPRFPDAPVAAIRVHDISMDKSLAEDSYALMIFFNSDADEKGGPTRLRSDSIVAVEQRHPAGKELIIRRVRLTGGRCNLIAETSQPDRFPTVNVETLSIDPSAEIRAVGEIYGTITIFADA